MGLLLVAPRADAGYTFYSIDPGVSTNAPGSNYNVEEQKFIAASGAFKVITFDGTYANPYQSDLGQGVTVSYSSVDTHPPTGWVYGITGDTNQNQYVGFNVAANQPNFPTYDPSLPSSTTNQFLRVVPLITATTPPPTDVTFHFSQNIYSFGVAITGLGGSIPSKLTLGYTTNGVAQTPITIAGDSRGGLIFFGISGLGPSNDFTFQLSGATSSGLRDIIGLDNVRWSVVPEPTSGVLMVLGLGLFLLLARRR